MADNIIKITQAPAHIITISQNYNRDGKDFKFEDFTPEQLELLKGEQGIQGIQGPIGPKGEGTAKAIESAESAATSALEAATSNSYAQLAMSRANDYAVKASQQADAASASGLVAETASVQAERFYRAMRYDIVGPPPELMTIANLIVGAGPAAMTSN